MAKHTERNNAASHRQIINAVNDIGRSPQKVECVYWDLELKCKVTKLEGPENKPYRGVPLGWSD